MPKNNGAPIGSGSLDRFCLLRGKEIARADISGAEKVFSLLKGFLRYFRCSEAGFIFSPQQPLSPCRHYCIDHRGLQTFQEEAASSLKQTHFDASLFQGKSLLVNDFGRKTPKVKNPDISKEIKSFLSVPLSTNRGSCCIYLVNCRKKEGFGLSEKSLLNKLVEFLVPLLLDALFSDELEKQVTSLQQSHLFKEEMMHMVVHDLKGPLAEVIANLDILKRSEDLDEDELDTLFSAEKGCTTLWNMILDILDLAKLQENKLELKKEKINIVDLIHDLLDGLKRQLQDKEITPQFNPQGTYSLIEADRGLLRRVLNNFILNAVNYSPEGTTIAITLETLPAKRIKISVHDQGRGIKEEDLPYIFEKFNQSSEGGGKFNTGLGLTFCKLAVESHGGEILVESSMEKGSTFHVVLPIGSSRLQLDGV